MWIGMLGNAKTRRRKDSYSRNQLNAGVSRIQRVRNDDIRQALRSQTTLLERVVQGRLRWCGRVGLHVGGMTID